MTRVRRYPAMKIGAIFPQTECGTDVAAIGEFVPVEEMGFDHLFVADHVLGADPATTRTRRWPPIRTSYDRDATSVLAHAASSSASGGTGARV